MRPVPSLRVLPTVAVLLAGLLLPGAVAQDPDGPPGCVEANPCDWIVAVDAEGFSEVSSTEFSENDWVVATIVNHDEVDHTVRLAGHQLDLTVEPASAGVFVEDSDPFRIGPQGQYTLSDDPSGDTVTITVVPEESFTGGPDDEDDSNGAPGVAPVLLLAAMVALAVAIRRR